MPEDVERILHFALLILKKNGFQSDHFQGMFSLFDSYGFENCLCVYLLLGHLLQNLLGLKEF